MDYATIDIYRKGIAIMRGLRDRVTDEDICIAQSRYAAAKRERDLIYI